MPPEVEIAMKGTVMFAGDGECREADIPPGYFAQKSVFGPETVFSKWKAARSARSA